MSGDGDRRGTPRPPGFAEADEQTGLPSAEWHAPGQVGFPISRVAPPVADRALTIAAGIVVLVVGLAVLKPWGLDGGRAPVMAPPVPAVATGTPVPVRPTPRPTADLTADGVAGPVCLGPSAWRIASLETWRDRDVRVWRAIDPVAGAAGPLDPAIPTVPVAGVQIEALGWCAPSYGPERPAGPEHVTAWMVQGGVAHELPLRRVLPERGTTHLAGLYVPVSACALEATCAPAGAGAVPQRWVAGRVVFRYEDLGTGVVVWLGVDVVLYGTAAPGVPATPAAPGG